VIRFRRTSSAVHVRRRDLFSYPGFRNAISGQFVSQTSDALTSFTLAELLVFSFSSGPSLSAMAWTLLISAIPLIVVSPIAGHLADRFNRKTLLRRGHIVRAIITAIALLATNSQFRVVGYVVFGLLLGLTRILYTARATSFPRLVRKHELVAADSTSLIVGVLAGSTGAGIGMAIAGTSAAAALSIAALGQLLASCLFGRISIDLGKGIKRASRGHVMPMIRQLNMPKTKFAMYATASHRFILGICIASVSLLVDSAYGLNTTGYVAVLGFSAAGSFCGSLTAEWVSEHFPRRSITVIAFSVSSALSVISCIAATPRIGLLSIAFTAFLFQNLRVRSDATIQSNVSKSNIGHVFAAYDMLYNLAFIFGAIVGIGLSGLLSFSAVLAFASISFAAMSIVFALINDGKSDGEDSPHSHPSIWREFAKKPVTAA
jgi:predicted MFS family arabinose efflux permease